MKTRIRYQVARIDKDENIVWYEDVNGYSQYGKRYRAYNREWKKWYNSKSAKPFIWPEVYGLEQAREHKAECERDNPEYIYIITKTIEEQVI